MLWNAAIQLEVMQYLEAASQWKELKRDGVMQVHIAEGAGKTETHSLEMKMHKLIFVFIYLFICICFLKLALKLHCLSIHT